MLSNWRELIRPRAITVDSESLTGLYGKFVCEPLERGFGITMGNSLRRILLSSVRGAAVTALRIEGVLHEFGTVPDVLEDVSEIVLNLKGLNLKLNKDGAHTVSVKIEGEREIKAADLFTGPEVTVMNPDHHVATLGHGGVLQMELLVKHGIGYQPVERNRDQDAAVGWIPMDSVFTPIRKVNYRVTNARVGHLTDYDRLTMEVWTNGAIEPRDAVAVAAKILKEQLQVFINFDETEEAPVATTEPVASPERSAAVGADAMNVDVLNRDLADLDLTIRAQNCLGDHEHGLKIRTVGELVQKTEAELLKTRNFGRKSLKEVKEALSDIGLSLGMKLEGWAPPPRSDRHVDATGDGSCDTTKSK